ncbi:MAG: hypothetical protein ACR2QK_15785, partial [Acidimicrobiales bacterium]
HVGRALGASRRQVPRTFSPLGGFVTKSRSAVFDPAGARLLDVRPGGQLFKLSYAVTGVATGHYITPSIGPTKLSIGADNEPYGSIVGRGFKWIHDPTLTILDHDDQPVGAIRSFPRRNNWSPTVDYVLSVKPTLRGELRRLLIAAPTVVAMVRRAQQQSR